MYRFEACPSTSTSSPIGISLPSSGCDQPGRKAGGTRRITLTNFSNMPPERTDAVRAILKGGVVFPSLEAAVLGALRRLGMPRILGRKAERNRILSRGVGRRTEMRNGRRNPAGPTSATKTTSASTGNNQQIRQSAVVAVHDAWMMDRVRDPGNAGS